jgi:hypothetical protein
VDTHTIKAAEWERLRTGIALKTFTALITRYQNMSEKEEQNKLKEARRFAKGLFFNVREDHERYGMLQKVLVTHVGLLACAGGSQSPTGIAPY